MTNLLEMLSQAMSGDTTKELSRRLGADETTTKNAMSAALPTLLQALARNASKPEGAESLHRALSKNHDGSVLDNLSGFLGQEKPAAGAGILKHVLGSRQTVVEQSLSRSTGLDQTKTNSMLEMLAPLVMGALGQEQKKGGLDTSALSKMLGQQSQQLQKEAPKQMGMLDQLLDADHDGDVDLSDLIKHGSSMFGKMFSGR